jgi:hypothetical protein
MGRLALVCVLALAASARAESLNVNFGPTGTTPLPSYAAAGEAGTWSTVTGVAGSAYDLIASDGTRITLTQQPTTTLIQTGDAVLTGDDAMLLNNGLVTTGAETCLMFAGFHPGKYEVLIYAWLPNQPSVKSRTRQDEAPATIDVGGAWTGAHVEGVTYARYLVDVGSDGMLPAHSGLAPNAPAAALNAVQIRPAPTGGTGPDAGMPGGGDTGDAGTDVAPHHGGCSTTGGAGWLVIAAVAMASRRARRSAHPRSQPTSMS